ncbi:hypothetical protein M2336_001055 [Sphingobium sp. B1D7B]|nr:hypothetical protein [Sphingobium sp. B1D7B]
MQGDLRLHEPCDRLLLLLMDGDTMQLQLGIGQDLRIGDLGESLFGILLAIGSQGCAAGGLADRLRDLREPLAPVCLDLGDCIVEVSDPRQPGIIDCLLGFRLLRERLILFADDQDVPKRAFELTDIRLDEICVEDPHLAPIGRAVADLP